MEHRAEIERAAAFRKLDPDLIEAIVEQESSGNAFAIRVEAQYRYFVDCRTGQPFRRLSPIERASELAPGDFPSLLPASRNTEWWAQQMSWGLMQVIGATARELGYQKPYLSELVDPRLGLFFGCMLISRLLTYYHGNVSKALAAYNAGIGGQKDGAGDAYAAEVLARFEGLKAVHVKA